MITKSPIRYKLMVNEHVIGKVMNGSYLGVGIVCARCIAGEIKEN